MCSAMPRCFIHSPPSAIISLPTKESFSMDEIFSDRLLAATEAKGSPICVGIDPIFEMLPDAIAGDSKQRDANDAEAAIDAIFSFTTTLLRLIAPHVPIVKFQSAYFEKY